MIIIYTWILLIVEISTPKPKSNTVISTPERVFFHSRTPPNGFECFFSRFLNAFFHSRTSDINPQNRSFIGFGVKTNQYWEVPGVYIYI